MFIFRTDKLAGNVGLSASSESIYANKFSRSRGSSARHRRASSRRNKENGSGSFRQKNNLKKPNTPQPNEHCQASNENCTDDCSTNISKNDNNIILKANHQNTTTVIDDSRSLGARLRAVTFGEKTSIVKTKPATTTNSNTQQNQHPN